MLGWSPNLCPNYKAFGGDKANSGGNPGHDDDDEAILSNPAQLCPTLPNSDEP